MNGDLTNGDQVTVTVTGPAKLVEGYQLLWVGFTLVRLDDETATITIQSAKDAA